MYLTQKEVQELFDYRNGYLFWRTSGSGRMSTLIPAGGKNQDGYRRIVVFGREWLEHQLVWLYVYGEVKTHLDHINRVRDDNRIENLRVATGSQNQGNRKLNKNNRSGYRGVIFLPSRNKYCATIRIGKSKLFLGHFNNIQDAREIYDKTAREWFGEYYSG
jgi:hypothetical protein